MVPEVGYDPTGNDHLSSTRFINPRLSPENSGFMAISAGFEPAKGIISTLGSLANYWIQPLSQPIRKPYSEYITVGSICQALWWAT